MILRFIRGSEHSVIENPSIEEIRTAVAACGDTHEDSVGLMRSNEDWVCYDGQGGIEYRQGGSGVYYQYGGAISYNTALDIFLAYAEGDESWKELFDWKWEDRGLA